MKFPKNYIIYKGVVYDLDKSDQRRAESLATFRQKFDRMQKRADTPAEFNSVTLMRKAVGLLPATTRERRDALLAMAGHCQRYLPDFHA